MYNKQLTSVRAEMENYRNLYVLAEKERNDYKSDNGACKAKPNEISVTETELKDARAKAYKYSEENIQIKAELTKRKLDGDLLMVEVGLRMKHQEKATKCQEQLDSMQEEMTRSGETKVRRVKAEAVAF